MADELTRYIPKERQALAGTFNRHLNAGRSFSFIRLGDGELQFMLRVQAKDFEDWAPSRKMSCENALGSPAVSPDQYLRLRFSFEQADVVDHYGQLPYNSQNLSKLLWDRPDQRRDFSSGAYGVIMDWLALFGRRYMSEHLCLFCGAEADILAELVKDPAYRELAAEILPQQATLCFLQPYRDGSFIAEDLDIIKEQVRQEISLTGVDTVFLSLGGGAKILASELAKEMRIRVLDIGSIMRSLSYSGSDGYAGSRSPHHVHLFRVPFAMYMRALLTARPRLSPELVLAKAHAQLCLEVQKHIPLRSQPSDVHDLRNVDLSRESRLAFSQGYAVYRSKYRPLAGNNERALSLVNEFTYWRRKKGLAWDGWIFTRLVLARSLVGRLLAYAAKGNEVGDISG